MLKNLLFYFTINLCLSPLNGATLTTSGVMKQNETWTGKIYITGDIVVPQGVILTIMPGTEISFAKESDYQTTVEGHTWMKGYDLCDIYIEGDIQAKGEADNMIIIDGTNFGGIVFSNKNENSKLVYCKIKNARNGVACLKESSPIIENCIFVNNKVGIECNHSSKPKIVKNLIENNEKGIICEGNSIPEITENSFIKNISGIEFWSPVPKPKIIKITKNKFLNNSWAVIWSIDDGENVEIENKDNIFAGNGCNLHNMPEKITESYSTILEPKVVELIFNKLEGYWASEKWYKTIIKTKSPYKAARCGLKYITHLSFTKDEKAYYIDKILSCFHEATGPLGFVIIESTIKDSTTVYQLRSGPVACRNPTCDDSYVATIRFINDDKIELIESRLEGRMIIKETFIKIRPSFDGFVNQLILEGNYRDKDGREYFFSKDGKTNLKGELVSYEIELNPMLRRVDSILIKGQRDDKGYPKRYGFEIKGDKLFLYNIKYVERWHVIEKDGAPFLILQKSK